MDLDLVGHERLVGEPYGLIEQRYAEIGDADVAGEPSAFDPAECPDRFLERHRRIGPMNEEKVHGRKPEPFQALVDRALEITCREAIEPYLGGDEDFLTLDAGRAQPLADLALVAVHLGSVEMPVALPQGRRDDGDTSTFP